MNAMGTRWPASAGRREVRDGACAVAAPTRSSATSSELRPGRSSGRPQAELLSRNGYPARRIRRRWPRDPAALSPGSLLSYPAAGDDRWPPLARQPPISASFPTAAARPPAGASVRRLAALAPGGLPRAFPAALNPSSGGSVAHRATESFRCHVGECRNWLPIVPPVLILQRLLLGLPANADDLGRASARPAPAGSVHLGLLATPALLAIVAAALVGSVAASIACHRRLPRCHSTATLRPRRRRRHREPSSEQALGERRPLVRVILGLDPTPDAKFRIWRLNMASQNWTNTGVPVDDRNRSHARRACRWRRRLRRLGARRRPQ